MHTEGSQTQSSQTQSSRTQDGQTGAIFGAGGRIIVDVAALSEGKLDARRMDALFAACADASRVCCQDASAAFTLDMSAVTFVSASGLVWLWTLLEGARKQGVNVQVAPPRGEGVQGWLSYMGFESAARAQGFLRESPPFARPALPAPSSSDAAPVSASMALAPGASAAPVSILLEMTRIADTADIRAVTLAVLDRVGAILAAHLGYQARDIANVTTALSEACQNICDHSGSEGMVAVQKYTRTDGRPFVVIGVADSGCGIRASLAGGVPEAETWSHQRAIMEALKRGTSGRVTEDRGLGLPRIKDIMHRYQGRLHLRSGDTRITISDEACSAGEEAAACPTGLWPGTQMCLSLSTRCIDL